MPRAARHLSESSLGGLGPGVGVPTYDRAAVRRSVVHIGVGGFHRSHLATYIDELCAAGNRAWGIVGFGLLPGDAPMRDALLAQDGLYSLITRDSADTTVQVIGSLLEYGFAAVDSEPLIERIADPGTQIVSLTVTEAGYPVDDSTGSYLENSSNAGPAGAFGIIAAGLERRRRTHGAPLTILSCDNIVGNGNAARTATLGESARHGQGLTDWIDGSVAFPNGMVDRITPATADADREWLAEQYGLIDRWPVVAEPFRQWVIEDHFAGERPPLEDLEVIVTDDVEPYEQMKLRLLNAAHSCLAHLAALRGIGEVHTAMADRQIARFVRTFLEREAAPVLPVTPGVDVDDYIDRLLLRFANPAIGDQIARLCQDGTAKFPKFVLPTVREQLRRGGPVELASLALAGWVQYLLGAGPDGRQLDPAPDRHLGEAVGHAQRSVGDPTAFLEFHRVFDERTARADHFRQSFTNALTLLRNHGVDGAIERTIGGTGRA